MSIAVASVVAVVDTAGMARPSRFVVAASALSLLFAAVFGCGTSDPTRRRRNAEPEPGEDDDDKGGQVDVPVQAPTAKAKPTMDPARTMTVYLLDVGQGAATLIELPCGAMLVDTGGEVNDAFDGVAALRRQLDAFFARRADLDRTLDLVVITHPHIDHVRGLPMVLETYKVKNVVDNGLPGDELVKVEMQAVRRFTDENASKGVGYRGVKNSDIVKKNGLSDDVIDPFACQDVDPQVRVLSASFDADPGWGTDNYGHAHFADMNNHSVVVRVDVGNGSLLITGDLEEVGIKALVRRYTGTRWLDVDVYQAGHHGSANGTTRELMAATTPSVALIAMGPASRQQSWTAWSYGHPRAQTVELLESGVGQPRPAVDVKVGMGMKKFAPHALDRAVYGTGWDGTVVVDLNASGDVVVR